MKKLYIEPVVPINTLADLIHCLYANPEGLRKTYANTTFLNEERTVVDCEADRRSFDDMLLLAQTYFPETTEVELMSTMADLNFGLLYCWNIAKIVFLGSAGNSDKTVKKGSFKEAVDYYKRIKGATEVEWAPGTYTDEQLKAIHEQI